MAAPYTCPREVDTRMHYQHNVARHAPLWLHSIPYHIVLYTIPVLYLIYSDVDHQQYTVMFVNIFLRSADFTTLSGDVSAKSEQFISHSA